MEPDVQGMAWDMESMYDPIRPQGPRPNRPPQGPWPNHPPQGPGPSRPPQRPNYPAWFWDIVKTMLLDEMHKRRCSRGICFR